MRKSLFLFLIAIAVPAMAQTDDSFAKFKEQAQQSFNQFRQQSQDDFDAFRKRVNDEYAEFMRQAWKSAPTHPADQPVEEKTEPPVIYQEQQAEEEQKPQPDEQQKTQPKPDEEQKPIVTPTPKPAPKPIQVQPDVVVVPKPQPAPEPIAPVKPKDEIPFKRTSISYFGTLVSIGFPTQDNLKITSLQENDLADAWQVLSDSKYDITVKTALDARQNLALCDWAYLTLLQQVCEKQYGKSNEAVLAEAFLMTQSGYRVRLAKSAQRLYMLVASRYQIYEMNYIEIDNTKFYVLNDHNDKSGLHICPSFVEKEQPLTIQLAQLPNLNEELTPERKLTSRKGVTATVSVNRNLIDFFGIFPKASVNANTNTCWVAYANTPMDKNVRERLYPVLKKTVSKMSEKEAVGIILNWVQTAFKYGYDDQIWGGDRPFFPQETLYYPFSDCEDRAILFSRLVRDIVGLDVVLLYYPGHLASAVAFNDNVSGDYLTYGNRRYVVCDPTYENAPVGATMPSMDNWKARIVVLK